MGIQADPAEASGSFADFFSDGYPRLVRAVLPATLDLGVAEEISQEAMTRIFARWSRVKQLDSPIGYAYVVAINVNRRRSRRLWTPLARDLADPTPDPAWQVASRDQLLTALAALSQGERDALLLVSFLGLNAEEAGRALRIKPTSVRSRLHRARTSLQELKEKEDG